MYDLDREKLQPIYGSIGPFFWNRRYLGISLGCL